MLTYYEWKCTGMQSSVSCLGSSPTVGSTTTIAYASAAEPPKTNKMTSPMIYLTNTWRTWVELGLNSLGRDEGCSAGESL